MVCEQGGAQAWMRRAGWVGMAFCVGVAGCTQGPTGNAARSSSASQSTAAAPTESIQVVATTSVLCDLTQQIAQETLDLTCLMDPGQDPHTYQAQPRDRQAIDNADLVLYDGYDASPALISLVQASSNAAPKVAVYEEAVPTPLMGKGHHHDHAEGEHDHAEGEHDHAEGEHKHAEGGAVPDPHVWHSAENVAAIARTIGRHLEAVNPAEAERYAQSVADLEAQFMALDEWIKAQVETVPVGQRKLVTAHDAFRYFAKSYGLEVKGALGGLSTREQPSAQALAELVEQVKGSGVPAIFAESTTNPELINTVATSAGVKVADRPLLVEGPGVKGSGAETTQAMLVANTCTIVQALGGTCDPKTAPLK